MPSVTENTNLRTDESFVPVRTALTVVLRCGNFFALITSEAPHLHFRLAQVC